MKETNRENHEFAIYTEITNNIAILQTLDTLEISNKELYNRIIKVLRIRIEDSIIFFNETFNVRCLISSINKDRFSIKVKQICRNKKLLPTMFWLLPLLKKEAFEDCLYTLTEMGAQEIQPIITSKSQQIASYLESYRLKNIMITAAEQSKQFILPHILNVQPLEKALEMMKLKTVKSKFFFDPVGSHISNVIKNLNQKESISFICAIGPEGDLTRAEKQLLKDYNFEFIKLTETVLRAKQAVAVATGIFRSLL